MSLRLFSTVDMTRDENECKQEERNENLRSKRRKGKTMKKREVGKKCKFKVAEHEIDKNAEKN